MSATTPHDSSRPMNIPGRRMRSGSESSDASVEMVETPGRESSTGTSPRIRIQPTTTPPAATSPVLSFFFAGSPTKTPTSFFSRPPAAGPITAFADDDDTEPSSVLPASAHARRFSSSWAKPMPTNPPGDDRGTSVLRRLSLSSAFGKPTFPPTHAGGTTPPNTSPVVPKTAGIHPKRPSPNPSPSPGRMRRSATIALPNTPKHRAPSPMGERILKGHFDGFV